MVQRERAWGAGPATPGSANKVASQRQNRIERIHLFISALIP